MNKKLIIFDLDGVLINTKNIHYQSLNEALLKVNPKYIITHEEHLTKYDGLTSKEKLNQLSKIKKLPLNQHYKILEEKQKITLQKIQKIKKNKKLIKLFKVLKNKNLKIACCSNAIKKTVVTCLFKLGIFEYFDLIISNEDVENPKPHPEIYWKAMCYFSIIPEETIIIEDSLIGLLAANRSKAFVERVKNEKEINIKKINKILNKKEINTKMKWKDDSLNILIPMAGAGSRFEKAGYTFPKPLINIQNKPMIQLVVENLNIEANYIFIVQKEHRKKYNLDHLLSLISPNCKIIETEQLTQGAACTTLLAKKFINNNKPLIIANSDQIIEWDSLDFMYKMQEQNIDAGILIFESTNPKWSFVKLNNEGLVKEVAEKKPISNKATVGIYFWKKGMDYVKYAEQMINKKITTNNEFYVCPVFNEAILENKKIKTYDIKQMWGLGTPEDLNKFLKKNNN